MQEFFRSVLPEEGVYVLATKLNKGFKHQTFDTLDQFYSGIETAKKFPKDLYFATGTLKEHFVWEDVVDKKTKEKKRKKTYRKHKNIRSLRCLFLDIDCGESKATEGKGYATQIRFFQDDLNGSLSCLIKQS